MRVLLHVMGCRLNAAEGARIRGALEAAGWTVVEDGATSTQPRGTGCSSVTSGAAGGSGDPTAATDNGGAAAPAGGMPPADAFVLHSCAVTGAAQAEALRRVRAARRAGIPEIVVAGCVANVAPEAELREAGATGVVSRRASAATGLAAVVGAALRGAVAPELLSFATTRAPVKIQDGCSFRCSYCIVPDARGEPRSRPFGEILGECSALVARGYREIVLSGVNVACWREGGRTLSSLVRAVASIPGLARVRMGSVEPRTTEEEVVSLMGEPDAKLCPTLHYPLQSGSDRILRAMRRRYSAAQYRAAVERALARVPRLGLGADVIAGFPGETDADFEETLRLVRDYPFSNLHAFPYSERPGTPAAEMPGAVPVRVRRERARALIAIGEEKRAAFAASLAGAEADVLVERVGTDGTASGWTGQYLRARIPGRSPADAGALLRVRVLRAEGDALVAAPV